jgi:hypothetical protein
MCDECNSNCDPEHGRHPLGCLFSGRVYGYWQIHPKCRLEHEDIAKAKAKDTLARMRELMPIRFGR